MACTTAEYDSPVAPQGLNRLTMLDIRSEANRPFRLSCLTSKINNQQSAIVHQLFLGILAVKKSGRLDPRQAQPLTR
jgi:hypothetical protein